MNTPPEHAKGTLYLVPAPLDFGCAEANDLHESLPLGTLQTAAEISYWVCENAKSARAYLKRINAIAPLCQSLQTLSLVELPREVHKKGDHNGTFDARPLLQPALDGHNLGLLSEAGMPAVADPGSSVVRAAHDLGVPVVPLVGPVSLLLALAASGLNGQNFTCHKKPATASAASRNWNHWRCAVAKASCSLKRRTAIWRCGNRWSKPCNPTPAWPSPVA